MSGALKVYKKQQLKKATKINKRQTENLKKNVKKKEKKRPKNRNRKKT